MKTLTKLTLMFLLVIGSVFAAGQFDSSSVTAHDLPTTQTGKQKKVTDYNYHAHAGDSYTVLVRKSVQAYSKSDKVKLTPAQIIYAETNLTIAAGSPYLNLDQTVAIKKSDVKSWVDKAAKLTEAEKTAWNYYVQFTDL